MAILLEQVADHLARRTFTRGKEITPIPWPFATRAAGLRGEWVNKNNCRSYLDHTGELTAEERDWLTGSIDVVDFIVIGHPTGIQWVDHGTPLAWHTPGGWHVIARRLESPTLRRYQRTLHLPGSPVKQVNGRWNHASTI